MSRCLIPAILACIAVYALSGCAEARTASPAVPGSYQSGGGVSPFYGEELHENRLYVFSSQSTWENFQKTKDMDPLNSRRLIGKGPNGITLIIETSKDEPAKEKRILASVNNRYHLAN
jgi:hypothetical protein